MMQTILIRCLLIAAGLVVGLFMAESAVRLFHLAPEAAPLAMGRFQLSANPKIAYERVPNLRYEGASLHFYDFRGSGNSLGYRSPDYGIRKPPGIHRIVVLGDSIAEGMHVDDDDAIFPRRVEKELRSAGYNVQVLNFAVSGYNTQQEVETLREKALRFEPDVVLLAYCINDREDVSPEILIPLLDHLKSRESLCPPSRALNSWLIASALYRFVTFRILQTRSQQDAWLRYDHYSTGDTVERSLTELAQLADEHRFRVMVAVFPIFDARDPRFLHYEFHSEHQRVSAISKQLGFFVLDLLAVFRDCAAEPGRSEELYADPLHPSGVGHQCAARAICRYIVDRRVLAPPSGN
ncbi:MAG: hypothetical protein AUJ92_16255 [Armatimonadetes bacterium CG2_30_59_28]|nr:SGNH/GDSL hydrolase family protein [Armatimonadota bacterium]OIO91588.1 MAG: hypothetical protein AUJ92_16255 [Armatimonadetes bacterium CG2_30_59_28]PIU60653.1 MAG: hypothetical protein COS85_23355 [Armatimonadetes bacterium CG07_land_8_20_14_0_80_59_28]PIX43969.1 MAG: hypothetical protein COZ56_05890 [Armatimonadetes bacterium CG_4_8_14_3_um_filter_58_9]PIY41037.1 MAG: hypothetical protein COZ05_16395 [Armatimonadetes bacterium CG_4_10_14_3_um_filter_59_10]PJB62763.1 MAG: hypothetical pro